MLRGSSKKVMAHDLTIFCCFGRVKRTGRGGHTRLLPALTQAVAVSRFCPMRRVKLHM